MTLSETASRLQAHLDVLAGEDGSRFYHPTARSTGRRIIVKYKSYYHENHLTKREADAYLAWLEAGKRGTHVQQQLEANPGF